MRETLTIGTTETLLAGSVQDFNSAKFNRASLCDITSSVGTVVVDYTQPTIWQHLPELGQQTGNVFAFVIGG